MRQYGTYITLAVLIVTLSKSETYKETIKENWKDPPPWQPWQPWQYEYSSYEQGVPLVLVLVRGYNKARYVHKAAEIYRTGGE